ncbi:MAG TPA: type II secretion system protein [Desulfomonilaceae bacterium]|nr:type II secretion system protein [Desulfomonilaceae bacterium]
MKNKGFTVLEMLVSLGIFLFVLSGTVGFFILQSRMAVDSKARKIVGQSVNSTLKIIANDILHAGAGIADPLSATCGRFPELSFLVLTENGSQQLYLNWSGFLDYDVIPNYGVTRNSAFRTPGYYELNEDLSEFALRWVPDFVKPEKDIGGIIARTKQAVGVSVSGEKCSIASTEIGDGTQRLNFTILDSQTGRAKKITGQVAPAIVYKWVKNNTDPDDKAGQIYRNSVSILGGKPGQSGRVGGNQFQVTDFYVQCKFYDAGKETTKWSAKDGTTAAFDLKNLKLVRVTIEYTWKVPHLGRNWSANTIDVVPRGLVKIGG